MSEFRFGISGNARTTIEIPVLIVGGGPVGLALASDLGARGVRCMLVEESDGFPEHPRGGDLNARSMEFMRRWGIADAVRAPSAGEGDVVSSLFCTSLAGYRLAMIERPGSGGAGATAWSPERAARCNQIHLSPLLRELASSFKDTTIRYRWRVESLDQRGECILASVTDLAARERRRIAAQIVVDCSGASSAIRSALKITMTPVGAADAVTSHYVQIPDLDRQHQMGRADIVEFVDAQGISRRLERIDDQGHYRLDVLAREDAAAGPNSDDETDCDRVLEELAGKSLIHQVLSVGRWTARNAVAEHFGEGRIILAGDAAHTIHPALPLGLDTGLADAVDLGWKIEATLAGWASSGLLDSYERERRPIAQANGARSEVSRARADVLESHSDIAIDTPSGRAARKRMTEALESGRHHSRVTDAMALGDRYRASPIVVADSSPEERASAHAPEQSQTLLQASDFRPTTDPGARAPHARMPRGASTLDLYGRGFVLLRLGLRAPEPGGFDRAFSHRGVPLGFVTIDDPRIAELHERRLVLVRPDGHVAWRGDVPPSDPLAVVDRVRGLMG